MNRTTTRLSLRLGGFELVAMGVAVLFACALTLIATAWMDGSGYGPACLLEARSGALSPACEAAERDFYAARSALPVMLAQALLVAVPFLLGASAGVAVVGRELERGTTRLAWSLAPSRTRWFVGRVVPVLGVVLGLSLVAGVAADRLVASMEPGTDVANGFVQFGFRGVVLAARAVFAFAVAVLAGAAIGRSLPALLVGAAIVVFGLVGGTEVHQRILEREAVPVALETYSDENLYFASGFLLPDGRFVGWDEIGAFDPQPTDGTEWVPRYPQAAMIVPGSRYAFVSARESLVLVGGGLVALLLAGMVVRRARPG